MGFLKKKKVKLFICFFKFDFHPSHRGAGFFARRLLGEWQGCIYRQTTTVIFRDDKNKAVTVLNVKLLWMPGCCLYVGYLSFTY